MTAPNEADPGPEDIMHDPAASFWIKQAPRSALDRDPVDAATDAKVLARVLEARMQRLLRGSLPSEAASGDTKQSRSQP